MSNHQNIPEESSADDIPPTTDDGAQSSDDPSPSKEAPLPAFEELNQTSNRKQQTSEAMEVHHHGHVHEKKKWKEYLFQFLMALSRRVLRIFGRV